MPFLKKMAEFGSFLAVCGFFEAIPCPWIERTKKQGVKAKNGQ
ncbi:hypothetical protein [Oxalobacter paraformigenes]|nr:hypothetical protein [Oxalobacter paraformigenes]